MISASDKAQETTNRRWTWLWLAFCILLATTVRAHGLGSQSMWWDESLSLQRALSPLSDILANRITLTDGATDVPTIDNHPQLYFLVLAATTRLLGTSEFALRFPSLAFSILLVPLLYVMGRRLYGDAAGRLAALMGALSPMYLWYSQEARMYVMAPFLALLSFYSLLRALDHQTSLRRRWSLVYIVATASMLLTHYLTFFVLAVEMLVALLVAIRSSRLRRLSLPLGFVLVMAAGVLLYALSVVPPPQPEGGFSFVPLPILARDVLNSFSLGLSVNIDDVIFVDVLFLLVVLSGLIAVPTHHRGALLPPALLLLLYLVVPFSLTYLAGYVRPVYMNSRHLIVITPAFYLALGAGLAAISSRRGLFLATLAALLIGIGFSWGQYFNNPAYHKDDHQAWGNYLRANVQAGDIVVVNPPHIHELYRYYAQVSAPWIGLPLLSDPSPDATQATLNRLTAQYRNIWLAQSYTPPWGDPDRTVEKWLDRTLTKTDERSFHSYASIVRVVRYATRPPLLTTDPPVSIPADEMLGGRLSFLGYDVVSQQAEPGRSLAYSLYLRSLQTFEGEVKVSLRLVDASGRRWAQADRAIGLPRPLTLWRDGTTVREDVNIVIPLGTPPGEYEVEMVLYLAASGETLQPDSGPENLSLGRASVARPAGYPHPSQLPLSHRIVGRAGPLALLGISIESVPTHQGDVLALWAYWRAEQKPTAQYLVRLLLQDDRGKTWVQQTYDVSAPAHGPLAWQQGEVARGRYQLTVPRDLPAKVYTLRFALENVSSNQLLPLQTGGLSALLGKRDVDVVTVNIADRSRSYTVPNISHPMSVNFGHKLTLLGYDVNAPQGPLVVHPGQTISLTLYLQARATMDTAYTIFVHLVDGDDRIWGQRDIPAGSAVYPTNLWWPGEVVSNTLTVSVRADVSAPRLTAVMGLYDLITSARLPIIAAQPSNRISLFSLDIR